MKRGRGIALLFLLITLSALCKDIIYERSLVSDLSLYDMEEDAFRNIQLNEEIVNDLWTLDENDRVSALTASMLISDYEPCKLRQDDTLLMKYKGNLYAKMKEVYQDIFGDLKFFPVAIADATYEDTWLSPRDYNGRRLHEGCDIFGPDDIAGIYPVISMTDGNVEQIGWLPLGGYRVGIRSPSGGYFYYAHLHSYRNDLKMGDTVSAGDILGFMGDSGYGEEGTTGQFPVHLHLGIYIETPNYEELSVNPYWVLQYIHSGRKIILYKKSINYG